MLSLVCVLFLSNLEVRSELLCKIKIAGVLVPFLRFSAWSMKIGRVEDRLELAV